MENKYIKSEYEIKKSKFITYIFDVTEKNEFEKIIKSLKEKHKKCRHICYAYKFFDSNNITNIKACDDGEPKGTAGYPLLSLIERNNLNNISIIVVRYFGGLKLGVGPLLRAYLKSATDCLKLNKLIESNKK